MDQTTLGASLTIVSKALDADRDSAWIAGAYFLTSTSFQLLYGRLSDVWSRKVLLVIGIAIFFFGSLAASLAQSAVQLIIFRAFTGVGGGGLMTVAQMIVSDIVPLRERGKYQGILVCRIRKHCKEVTHVSIGVCRGTCKWHWPCDRRRACLPQPRLLVSPCNFTISMSADRFEGDGSSG